MNADQIRNAVLTALQFYRDGVDEGDMGRLYLRDSLMWAAVTGSPSGTTPSVVIDTTHGAMYRVSVEKIG